ncbi:MAG: Omp28-related outer membrane protein [Flavobacteriaceae bacterium]|nr:Omp28-related outer membrane protein [Flavobacteriaceae bacterium]
MIKISLLNKIGLFVSVFAVFASCNRDDLNEMKSIHVKVPLDVFVQEIDHPFNFIIEGDNLIDLTSIATIKVNGVAITGNVFTPTNAGIYKVQAYYEDFISKPIYIEATLPSVYSQKVLVEDYTGTWCGHCPRIAYAINMAKSQSNKVVSVAVHVDANDPYKFSGSQSLKTTFGINGLPAGRINRINVWTNPVDENIGQVLNKTGNNAPLGLAIASTINNNIIDFTIRVGFLQTFNNQLNVVVYLVENGLIYDQVNYTEYFGGAGVINNYVHNDVLRALFTDIYGTPIPISSGLENSIYQTSMQGTIPASVISSNYENLHLVAFVVRADTKEVINVQEVAVGSEIGFE